MKYTVRLGDDTVGKINSDTECFIGEIVRVKHDENGNQIDSEGKFGEIVESSKDWGG
jgi:hypothetical protein